MKFVEYLPIPDPFSHEFHVKVVALMAQLVAALHPTPSSAPQLFPRVDSGFSQVTCFGQ